MLLDGEMVIDHMFDGDLITDNTFEGEYGSFQEVTAFDWYEGPYEITPSGEAQTISIKHLMASENITVNPIPDNYGLITWDGAVLTVS